MATTTPTTTTQTPTPSSMPSAEAPVAAASAVQRVSKASSDQLLRKFSDDNDDDVSPRTSTSSRLLHAPIVSARRKRSRRVLAAFSARERPSDLPVTAGGGRRRRRMSGGGGGVVEWKTLLPVSTGGRKPSASLLKRMGIGRRSAEDVDGFRALLAALEKTWRKTVEGASKMFIEKHSDANFRLIGDMV